MGKTGLSVANFLKRNNENAIYFDSRKNPPQLDDFKKLFTKENILLPFLLFNNSNTKILIIITHKDPPKTPVYLYQFIKKSDSEKTFPRVNHGHDKSQFRCKYSNDNQKIRNEK